MSRRWVYWGLVIMPLVWWPWATIPYEVPKVTIFLLWSAILFVFTALDNLHTPRVVRLSPKGCALLGLYFLALLIASYWGVDWVKSITGNYYRRDGLFTIATLLLVSVVVSWIKVDRQKVFQSLVVSGVMLSILAIIKGIGGWSVFGNPNFLAGYLVTIFPAYFAVTHARGALAWLIILLHHVALLMTQSWVGVILIIGYWIWRVRRRSKLVYLLVVPLIVGLAIMAFIFTKQAADSLVKSNHYNADSRARVYLKMVLGGTKRPILGYGVANADYAFGAVIWPMKFDTDIYVDKAHGSMLEVFVTSGVVGLVAYLALIGYVFWKARYKPVTLQILLLSFLFAQTNIVSVSQEVVFWVLTGSLVGIYNHPQPKGDGLKRT